MVIVHPDEIAGLVDLGNAMRKSSINSLVMRVIRVGRRVFSSHILPQQVVEQRPQSYENND
jgi:hypothetical protein